MPGNLKKGCGSCTKGGSSLPELKKHVGALRNKVGSGKRKQRKSKKGGGSDYLMVHNSRGNVITTDSGGSNGLSSFRQFTKTGQYIPNSKLTAAAAPISAGIAKDMSVPPTGHAYDPHASTLGSLTGGKRKKKTTTKPKRKTTKKKTTTKPKRKTSKKKRTTKPKRKTSTKKRTTTRRKKRTTKKKSLLNRVRSALSL